jgi:nucleotide-binding universal stress UspA family protein
MFRRILVALDGSAHAGQALNEAIDLAKSSDGSLTLMAVAPEPSIWLVDGAYRRSEDLKALLQQIDSEHDSMLKAAAETVPDGVPCATVLAHGSPGPTIVEHLEKGEHDLVAVGSRGRGAIRSLLLGSVSQHVAQASPVPVLIAHAVHPASSED